MHCIICNQELIKVKFPVCINCKLKARRYKVKKRAVDYKGGCCSKCGYNKCIKALEFHHLDPSKKEFLLGDCQHKTWEDIRVELDKCDLLCSNCHREIHSNLESYDKYIELDLKQFHPVKKQRKKRQSNIPCKIWLSQLIWMLPTTEIAKIYEVTDKAVEKWCKKYNLEKPSRGYWLKNMRR